MSSQPNPLKSRLVLKRFVSLCCLLVVQLLAAPRLVNLQARPLSQTAANPTMNLVSIVTDDQALWSIGAYGNREAITPNMDRLAREGVKFNNAFVTTPVCSPSRVAFLTGLYGSQVGITDYLTADEGASGMGLPASCADLAARFAAERLSHGALRQIPSRHAAGISSDATRLRLLHGFAAGQLCAAESAA